jgi:SAM-dependent methyltransferase
MIGRTYNEYRSLFRRLDESGELEGFQRILEVGALPDERCILACDELSDVPEKIGINLTETGSFQGIQVVQGDARQMPFDDDYFDMVMAASVLEHVPDFWRAVDEMKRCLKPGGWLIISTPGYGQSEFGNKFRKTARKLKLPDLFQRGTTTMRIHDAPHDYYRFSKFCYRDVILDGCIDVDVWHIMEPPRIYGMGRLALPRNTG